MYIPPAANINYIFSNPINVHCPLNTVQWTLSTEHCPVDTVHWTLSSGQWTLDTVQWTLSTGHCPVDTVQCTYIAHTYNIYLIDRSLGDISNTKLVASGFLLNNALLSFENSSMVNNNPIKQEQSFYYISYF